MCRLRDCSRRGGRTKRGSSSSGTCERGSHATSSRQDAARWRRGGCHSTRSMNLGALSVASVASTCERHSGVSRRRHCSLGRAHTSSFEQPPSRFRVRRCRLSRVSRITVDAYRFHGHCSGLYPVSESPSWLRQLSGISSGACTSVKVGVSLSAFARRRGYRRSSESTSGT